MDSCLLILSLFFSAFFNIAHAAADMSDAYGATFRTIPHFLVQASVGGGGFSRTRIKTLNVSTTTKTKSGQQGMPIIAAVVDSVKCSDVWS